MRAHVHDNVGFFCALLLLAPIVVKFLLRCSSRSMSATYHDPIARAQTHITINSHCWWNPCEIQHSSHYVLAYNRSRVPTCQILESSSGRTPHVVRDRSASELPTANIERQTFGQHADNARTGTGVQAFGRALRAPVQAFGRHSVPQCRQVPAYGRALRAPVPAFGRHCVPQCRPVPA